MKNRMYGLVLGRFQPLHVAHMEYLEGAKRHCERLVIGITNPDIRAMVDEDADANRSKQESNPFSYILRYEMIDRALRDADWAPDQFIIAPALITETSRMAAYLPPKERTTVFITVYDKWGDEKAKRMERLGYKVHILWRRDPSQKVISGTEIRRLMRSGGVWQHWVPGAVVIRLRLAGLLSPSGRLRSTEVAHKVPKKGGGGV
jgi:cytidyltransferase-like protein